MLWSRLLPTCNRKEAPKYSLEDYPYIQLGFLRPNYSLAAGLASFFEANNETTNVHTQFYGLMAFVFCFFFTIFAEKDEFFPDGWDFSLDHPPHDVIESVHTADFELKRRCLELMLASNCLCCFSSLLTHLYQARNQKWHEVLSVADWAGTLVILFVYSTSWDFIVGSNEIVLEETVGKIGHVINALTSGPGHVVVIFLSVAIVLSIFAFLETSHTTRFFSIFILAIVMNGPPIAVLLPHTPMRAFLAIVCFFIGGLFFSSHYPEKLKPYWFDLWLSSHTLWHIFYLCGLYFTQTAAVIALFGRVPWEDEVIDFFSF